MSRRGAQRVAEVPADVLAGLNAGRLETATLAEMLAMDLAILAAAVCPDSAAAAGGAIDPAAGITRRMAQAGALLREVWGDDAYGQLVAHPSDTARGWAAYVVAQTPGLSLAERLRRLRPLADDSHFGVREWAWLAARPCIAADLEEALGLLQPWTAEASANLRRFAVEITRPRGVWCGHLPRFKQDPAPARPLLEAVRADDSRYVQNSTANWLNDAAKTRPDWVAAVVGDWRAGAPNAATAYICRRAMRSVR